MFSYKLKRVYMDEGNPVNIMYEHCFTYLLEHIKSRLRPLVTPLISFSSERTYPKGKINSELTVGIQPLSRMITLEFYIVKSKSEYNVLLGRTAIQNLSMNVSTIRSMVQFQTKVGLATIRGDYLDKDLSLLS
ncbi:hypothetical protein CTI12_AA075110 [Artemisia annua]|uniref:Uncharacterized protein n=1 Tax=Artemisia annua TaxID=35608 RepID=A0A2U1Q4Y7_ARTAN|nr:hypothetical protein CTI12_AA075110 [Artemisia annua]